MVPAGDLVAGAARNRSAKVVLVAMAVGVVALAGCGATETTQPTTCASGTPTLVAAGSGQTTETPNEMHIVAGIDVTDHTAEAALADDDIRSDAVIASLRQNGVARVDIQTIGLSIAPQFAPNSSMITGYDVTNQVTATVLDLAHAGAVIDAVAAAAGNAIRLDGVTFSESDPYSGDSAARADAVAAARADARAMATRAGEALGPVCSISDTGAPGESALGNPAATASAFAASTPIEPGTTQTTAQVDVTFAISRPGAKG